MPALSSFDYSFDYALLRIVPRVEREEFINAGVVVFCLERRFLGVRLHLDERRLKALWPNVDVDLVRSRLDAYRRVCEGDLEAGPMARLAMRERFHWLVAPRSTVVQVSPVHSGICANPEETIERLFERLLKS